MLGHLGVSTPGPFLCTTIPHPHEYNKFLIEILLLKEAELVYTTFHNWIRQALQLGLKENKDGALLIDLHGHGHPHEYIELGFRLSASLLNNIANEEEETRFKRMSF